MSTVPRTQRLAIRIAPVEAKMLQALAASDGLTASEWVRFAIRHAHAGLSGAGRPTPRPDPFGSSGGDESGAHADILRALSSDATTLDTIAAALRAGGREAAAMGLGRRLNTLRSNGYVAKVPGQGYTLTDKGRAKA